MRLPVSIACLAMFALPMFGQRTAPLPPGLRHKLQRPREYALPQLSERERALLKSPDIRLRIGVHRTLPDDIAARGQWDLAPDSGRVWRMVLSSPGSAGMRLEFTNFDIGAGKVWVTAGSQVAGPYTGRGHWNDGHFWTETVFADSAVLEYEPAPEHRADFDLPFTIANLAHEVIAASDAPVTGPLPNPDPAAAFKDTADTCHLDPNCYPEWKDTMSMVAQIIFEDNGVTNLCSASLLNTRDHSKKPYLLTAGHCLHNEAAARSMQTYWTYQKTGCTANPPQDRSSSTKSTQGANLLAFGNMGQGDFSFLLLKDVPAGVQFSDWDTGDPGVGSPLVAVHHPAGSYKRISFGTRLSDATQNVGGDIAPGEEFFQVGWDKGRVEHGSSGSPLFSSPGVIVGELSYGLFSEQVGVCAIDPSFAGYGRFSNLYPYVKDYLENLPSASVTPAVTDVRFTVLNGVPSPARQTVRLNTQAASAVTYKLRSDAPWIKLGSATGAASATTPGSVDITPDVTKFDKPGQYQSTVTILTGAAAPVFINVYSDVKVDKSDVAATITRNPSSGTPATPLYSFTIRLEERAGVATRLTNVKVNGDDFSSSIKGWFDSDIVPAKGVLEAKLSTNFPYPPGSQYFEFWGVDEATGRKWYITATGTF